MFRNCFCEATSRYYCTQTKSQQQHYKMTIFFLSKGQEKRVDLCFVSLVTWLFFFFFLKLDLLGGQTGTCEGKRGASVSIMQILIDFVSDIVKSIIDFKFWSHKKAMQIVLWFCLGFELKKGVVGRATGVIGGENCLPHVLTRPNVRTLHYVLGE